MPRVPTPLQLPPGPSFGITLPANRNLLRALTSSVEEGARAFGLDERPAMNLALAAEELFLKLCADRPGHSLEVGITRMATAVRLEISVRGADLDLRAFNLAAGLSPTDLDDMGLFLAARLVDDLQVEEESGGLRVILRKQRAYPRPQEEPLPAPGVVNAVIVRPPLPEELVLFTQLQRTLDPPLRWEAFLQVPGQLVDLVSAGEWSARCAFGPHDELVGGIFWRPSGRSAEALGPFLFGQGLLVGAALVEACVAELARGQAVGLLFLDPPDPFPPGAAEHLGDWKGLEERSARFRLLQEDPGSVAWCHPALEPWVRAQCTRLVLPREIRAVSGAGTWLAEHSVFFSRLAQGRAELHPVRMGQDLAANLEAHLDRFASERLGDVRCTLDLGEAWQTGFAPVLLDAGFEPRLLLPYRGRGDEVLFQRMES